MASATAKMSIAHARKIASELVSKESDGMFAIDIKGKQVKTSATSSRITCEYQKDTETMKVYSSYLANRELLLEELKSLKNHNWE